MITSVIIKNSQRQTRLTGIIFCLFFISGCVTVIHPPVISDEEEISQVSAQISWMQVLGNSVDSIGRVDFKYLADNPHRLHHYIKFIAQSSPGNQPEKFSTYEKRLAYYLNSYNSLAIYGVISIGIPKDFERFWDRANFFKFTTFNIGGKNISLYDYENKIIRPLGDPRIHFALNCMVKGCPRLPKSPFRADTIDSVLNSLSEEFVNHPRHVEVLDSERLVRISEIFKFYTEDFVNEKSAHSLIAYINRYRKVAIPENYHITYIPYDWSVNSR